MKNKITLLSLLFVFQTSIAQEVKFTEATYDNGLTYPVAEISSNADATAALNENVLKIVSEYEDQDYCISRHGFVQHNGFIQMNFYFNCIDLDESKTELHLFNLSNGQACLVSEMLQEKEEKKFEAFFQKKVSAYYTQHGKAIPDNDYMNNLSIDDCTITFKKAGLEISLESQEDWPDEVLLIRWSELSPYLKHRNSRY